MTYVCCIHLQYIYIQYTVGENKTFPMYQKSHHPFSSDVYTVVYYKKRNSK